MSFIKLKVTSALSASCNCERFFLFLRYFKFICRVICYKNNQSKQGKDFDELDLLKEYFNKNLVIKNIKLVEEYFDCWLNIPKSNIKLNV